MTRACWPVAMVLASCAAEVPDVRRPNRPIRVVDAMPMKERLSFYNANACASRNPTFSLMVEDEDEQDTVHSLWFIDRSTQSVAYSPSDVPGGSVVRTVTAPAGASFRAALADLSKGTHVLTAYVSDTPFLEYDGTITTRRRSGSAPDGGPYEDRSFVDSYTWVLDVEACP